MSGPRLTRRRVVQIGTEAVAAGTEAATYNSLIVFDPVVTSPKEFEKRRPAAGYNGGWASIMAEHIGQMTFRTEMRGNGAALTPFVYPALSSLLLGAGAKVTGDTFTPVSSMADRKTISVKVWEDGLLKKLTGAVANIKIVGRSARPVMLEATVFGTYEATTDLGAAPAAPPRTPIPPRLAGATFTIDGQTPRIANFTMDLQNVISPREDIGKVAGLAHHVITDWDPQVTIDPESQLVAEYDWLGKLMSSAEVAFSMAWGAPTGNQMTLALPKLQYVGADDADRTGKAIHSITCQANSNVGDDEWSLAFA